MYICHDAAQQSAVPYSNGGYIEMKVKLDVREIKHKTKHINLFHKTVMYLYTVFQKKTSTHIIGYKLKNSCPILIIFDIKIPHIT